MVLCKLTPFIDFIFLFSLITPIIIKKVQTIFDLIYPRVLLVFLLGLSFGPSKHMANLLQLNYLYMVLLVVTTLLAIFFNCLYRNIPMPSKFAVFAMVIFSLLSGLYSSQFICAAIVVFISIDYSVLISLIPGFVLFSENGAKIGENSTDNVSPSQAGSANSSVNVSGEVMNLAQLRRRNHTLGNRGNIALGHIKAVGGNEGQPDFIISITHLATILQ